LDDKPFIVMPLMRNGNAFDFVQNNPSCSRVRIVSRPDQVDMLQKLTRCQISGIASGLAYLHGRKIVHGDMKAVRDGFHTASMLQW
jgi:serine/threonine protein kinase